MSITRRDFLNGTALTIAAGLTPAMQLAAAPQRYPPALTGLRGQHPGSFEAAHTYLRDRRPFDAESLPIEERYDLVVVGGGLSGLAAAWFYRRRAGPQARILILDNHDDFGGHAKRNEFTLDGRRMIGYGGSQSFQSPNTFYSEEAKALLAELGVDIRRFETAFDRDLYHSLGLSRALFLPRESFGHDTLLPGDPLVPPGNEAARRLSNAKPLEEFVAAMPLAETSRRQLLALYDAGRDPMAGRAPADKLAALKRLSYRDYLTRVCGCSGEVADCFQGRTLGYFGLGIDAVPAADLIDMHYPGFAGLKLARPANPAWSEPYIYHFPDGNASLARLMVRALVPGAAPGHDMEDVVEAPFDYGALDRDGQALRIRLDSTVLDVRNAGDSVRIAYTRDGALHKVEARHAVLACWHMVMPHIMPELPAEQRSALAKNVKTPIVYTNVLVRNWQAFANLKISGITAPMSFHHLVTLDFPVSLGSYRHPRRPSEPMVLHLAHVAGEPNRGLDARSQFRIGQHKLLDMTFADFEERVRDDLDRMLAPGGFSSARDIAAITVNRWPHGYSYVANTLFDPEDYDQTVLPLARKICGRVAIANTDSGGDAWVHFAIDQADRAVRELVG